MDVLRRCPLAIAQRLVHCAIALSTAVLDRVTKTVSVAPLLMNNLDNSKQKTSNLLSPAPPPYSWSLLGKSEGPAPPPSSKISWSFDLAWNPAWEAVPLVEFMYLVFTRMPGESYRRWLRSLLLYLCYVFQVLRMYLWWSLCTLYLHACQVRVTVGDSGLCCCTCVMYFQH